MVGRRCCCTDCIRFFDDFTGLTGTVDPADWLEDTSLFTGGGPVPAGKVGCTAANKAIATQKTVPSQFSLQHVEADIDITNTGTKDVGGLIIDYVDANNYFWGELSSNGTTSQMNLYDRSAGTDTLIAQSQHFDISSRTSFKMELCVPHGEFYDDHTLLKGVLDAGLANKIDVYRPVTLKNGKRGGIRSGDHVSDVYWDNFLYNTVQHTTDCPDCPAVGNVGFCNDCVLPPADWVKVTLPSFESLPSILCPDAHCDDIAGTYLLPFQGGAFGFCQWQLVPPPVIHTCIRALTVAGSGNGQILVSLRWPSGPNLLSTNWLSNSANDCSLYWDGESVPFHFSFGAACGPSSPDACLVTSL